MDFSNAVAHGGLSAKGTATGQGVKWNPRVGTAARRTLLTDADVSHSFTVTFPEASGRVELTGFSTGFGVGSALPARDGLSVADVTGTDAALVNGDYTRSATLYNYAPQWIKGDAVIRLATSGLWSIVLSGVAQFTASRRVILPTFADFDDAGGAGTNGPPLVLDNDFGDAPVTSVVLDPGGLDVEGRTLPAIAAMRAVEVMVTAGSGLLSLDSGASPQPLATGGWAQLVIPAAVPAGLLPYLIFVASEPGTVIQVTTVGVAA